MNKCGCLIRGHTYPHPLIQCNEQICPQENGFRIVYCPLHANAEKMTESVQLLFNLLHLNNPSVNGVRDVMASIRQMIAKVSESKKNELS